MAIIQIPVLFDMSGDTLVFAEEVSGDFVSSHLDFLLDMTTEANDISLNAADISSAILIGDQDTGDNIFYSGSATSNIAVDNLCNRIAKAITRGKLVHIPKSGDSSNSGIPMGGRLYVVRTDGQEEVPPDGQYAAKYLHSIAPIGDEQMLGEAMARVTSVHLMGTPLAASVLVDKNSVQTELETASGQTYNSGNTAFYNALAVQLSKVLGGSKSSAPMKNGITTSVTTTAFNNTPQIKITADDAAEGDEFGRNVAVSGNYAIVGSKGDDDGGNSSGSAYIFDVTNGNQLRKLTASDADGGDYFGCSVAISGTKCIVGASGNDDTASYAGSAYIFDVTNGNQLHKLTASDAAEMDEFGSSVAISGNYALVGAAYNDDDGLSSGSVYVFDVTNGNELRKLTASDAASSEFFGAYLAISGDKALIAKKHAAYIFDVTNGNQLHKLVSDDISTTPSDNFGSCGVAISGNYAIVGARYDDDDGENSGSAYVFDVTTGNQLRKLTASDAAAGDRFGNSISASGNFVIIGTPRDDNPNDSGSAYIFDVTTGTQLIKLTASDAADDDQFGLEVGIDGNYAIVGAWKNDDDGENSGSAYIFTTTTTTTTTHPLDASGTSVPALKSIFEQLMNVPGRSQIMPTRDVIDGGAVDNSNVTITGGFPFIPGDKLVMYLRPKIVFAAQTQAESHNNLFTFNYTGSTVIGVPVYNIADKNSSITGQVYTQSSSQDNTNFTFERATTGAGVAGNAYWTSGGNTYNNTTGVHDGANANGNTTNVDIGTTPPATTNTIIVTVGDNGGNKFKIDGTFNPIITLIKGNTYVFDQSDATNSGHQIQISTTQAGSNTSYTTSVGTPGTAGSKTTIIVPANAPGTLHYNCDPHGQSMGNSISVINPLNSIDGEWGQIDMGESTWATELKLTTNNSYNDRSPREFRLLASTDETNWKTLIHKTEAGPWVDDTPQTFTISNPTSYRYYRYVVIKCYNAVNGGNIDARTSIGHFNLKGVKYPSEVIENTNAGLMDGSPLDISGLQTNVVASSATIQTAFPGNATNGPEAETQKWGWMGSTNSDSLTLDSTDVTDPRTIDLHIWKITITL